MFCPSESDEQLKTKGKPNGMKTLTTPALSAVIFAASLSAFAQGKILFANNSLHLAFFDSTWGPDEQGLVNPTNTSYNLPIADLYMGTSSSSLSLVTSTTFNSSTPGIWNPVTLVTPFPGGSSVFIVAAVRDGTEPAPATWSPTSFFESGSYFGVSDEFMFTLGAGITYPAMLSGAGNWPVGPYNLDAYGTGDRGSIAITYIPEPSVATLAGISGAGLMMFRRRGNG
jgi:hypothetical protein